MFKIIINVGSENDERNCFIAKEKEPGQFIYISIDYPALWRDVTKENKAVVSSIDPNCSIYKDGLCDLDTAMTVSKWLNDNPDKIQFAGELMSKLEK